MRTNEMDGSAGSERESAAEHIVRASAFYFRIISNLFISNAQNRLCTVVYEMNK